MVNLHYMLSKTVVKARPSVLWCYKKELYLSSHKKKRMQQIKKMAQVRRALLDALCLWRGGAGAGRGLGQGPHTAASCWMPQMPCLHACNCIACNLYASNRTTM